MSHYSLRAVTNPNPNRRQLLFIGLYDTQMDTYLFDSIKKSYKFYNFNEKFDKMANTTPPSSKDYEDEIKVVLGSRYKEVYGNDPHKLVIIITSTNFREKYTIHIISLHDDSVDTREYNVVVNNGYDLMEFIQDLAELDLWFNIMTGYLYKVPLRYKKKLLNL